MEKAKNLKKLDITFTLQTKNKETLMTTTIKLINCLFSTLALEINFFFFPKSQFFSNKTEVFNKSLNLKKKF